MAQVTKYGCTHWEMFEADPTLPATGNVRRHFQSSVETRFKRRTWTASRWWWTPLYGTGLDRPIQGIGAEWIRLVNATGSPKILAVDLPSGLCADRGVPLGPTIKASRTVTFVAPKLGMVTETAARYCGSIDVVSIGTPDSLLRRFGVPAAG